MMRVMRPHHPGNSEDQGTSITALYFCQTERDFEEQMTDFLDRLLP